MKLLEKIIIVIFVTSFALQLFGVVDHISLLGFLLLSSTYLFGGYWLFNTKENKKLLLPIASGILFSASLITTFYKTEFSSVVFSNYTPFLNGFHFVGIGIFWIIKNNTGNVSNSIKYIFARSGVILILTCFFSYSPASFKFYRTVMLSLNRGDAYTTNYFSMFDYGDKANEALKNNDCDDAIGYAAKAYTAGINWLGDDTAKKTKLNKIGRTYQDLYSAYKCKAEREYNNSQFDLALLHYNVADNYLNTFDYPIKYWNEEKSWSLKMIALCYMNLKKYKTADSLFIKALKNYVAVNGVKDIGFASLLSSYAMSVSKELDFVSSDYLYKISNELLRKDSTNKKDVDILLFNYNQLALNYIHLDSIPLAITYLQKALKIERKNDVDFCETMIYYGVCLNRIDEFQKADSIDKQSLACYQSHSKPTDQDIAECYLALSYNSIALAKFDEARNYINLGIEITRVNYGENSERYANYLMAMAYLNEVFGDYITSEQQYNQVLRIYTTETGSNSEKIPDALCGLAHVEISLSRFGAAKEHSDKSYATAKEVFNMNSPATSEILNDVAYVDYTVGLSPFADSLYKKVIRINYKYNLSKNAATASALNGLGLVETTEGHYKKADSLLTQSLILHKIIYKENHPFTANVYLNYATLCIKQGKLSDAEEKLNKALDINKQFFNDGHDVFGDIYATFGDLAKKNGKNDVAKDYYRKALEIYRKKFEEYHWKVVMVKRKI